jgi:hypothetical protein
MAFIPIGEWIDRHGEDRFDEPVPKLVAVQAIVVLPRRRHAVGPVQVRLHLHSRGTLRRRRRAAWAALR